MKEVINLTDRQVIAMSIVLQETLLSTDIAITVLQNPRPRLRELGLSKADIEQAIAYGDYLWDVITADQVKDAWAVKQGEKITTEPELSNRQVIAMSIVWQGTLLDADAAVKTLQNPKARLEELGISESDITNIMNYIFYVFEELLKLSMEAWQEDYEEDQS